eukprot:1564825-Pyramimonas_sp.AAC.1
MSHRVPGSVSALRRAGLPPPTPASTPRGSGAAGAAPPRPPTGPCTNPRRRFPVTTSIQRDTGMQGKSLAGCGWHG